MHNYSASQLKNIFEDFNNRKVLVVGDVMLDAYWWGHVNRLSPEAPVPIVSVERKEYRLGGAANVALNVKELGAEAYLLSVIGDDYEGQQFSELIEDSGLVSNYIIKSNYRPTTVKTRVIGNQHQLLRVDSEQTSDLDSQDKKELIKQFEHLLPNVDAIIFEDYDKGILSKDIIKEIIKKATQVGVPVMVDPKKKNFSAYKGSALFKPNLKELQEGLKLDLGKVVDTEQMEKAALQLLEKNVLKTALITMSDKGVYVSNGKEHYHIGAHLRSIYDVSGAGDTVISVAALMAICTDDIRLIAEVSNIAGGLVCEKVGVVPVDKDQLLNESIRILST